MENNILLIVILSSITPEMLRIVKDKYNSDFSDYFKKSPFWLGLLFQVGLGLLTVFLYQLAGNTISNLDAFAISFSAPEIITKLVSTNSREIDSAENILDYKPNEFKLTNYWN